MTRLVGLELQQGEEAEPAAAQCLFGETRKRKRAT